MQSLFRSEAAVAFEKHDIYKKTSGYVVGRLI